MIGFWPIGYTTVGDATPTTAVITLQLAVDESKIEVASDQLAGFTIDPMETVGVVPI